MYVLPTLVSNPSDLPTDPEENRGPIGVAGLRPLEGVRRSLYATFAGRTLQPNGCLYRHWVVGAHLQCTVINNPYINSWSFHGMMSCKKQLETYSHRSRSPARSAVFELPRPAASFPRSHVHSPPVLPLPSTFHPSSTFLFLPPPTFYPSSTFPFLPPPFLSTSLTPTWSAVQVPPASLPAPP